MGGIRFNRSARQSAGEARSAILACAMSIFAERGYHETTVRHLADEIGVRPASIYYHFHDKQTILREIIQQATEELLVELQRPPETGDARRHLIEMLRTHLHFIYAHSDQARIILEQTHLLRDEEAEAVRAIQRRILDFYRACLTKAYAQHGVENDTASASLLALSVINGFFRWARTTPRRSLDQQIASSIAFIMGGLGLGASEDDAA